MSSEEIQRKECFNSLNEPILQKIEKISDVLKDFEGQSLINIDRSWFYWDTFLDKLKIYPSLNQVLLKSPVKKNYWKCLETLV